MLSQCQKHTADPAQIRRGSRHQWERRSPLKRYVLAIMTPCRRWFQTWSMQNCSSSWPTNKACLPPPPASTQTPLSFPRSVSTILASTAWRATAAASSAGRHVHQSAHPPGLATRSGAAAVAAAPPQQRHYLDHRRQRTRHLFFTRHRTSGGKKTLAGRKTTVWNVFMYLN